MERKTRVLLVRLEKRQIANAKKQQIVDDYLAAEKKRIMEKGLLMLPGTEKYMGGS